MSFDTKTELGLINKDPIDRAAMLFLKTTKLWERARSEYFDIKVKRYMLAFPELPPSFSGKKILFISDLHYPARGQFHKNVLEAVRSCEFDYCLLGGDYAWGNGEFPIHVCRHLNSLIGEIRNHTDVIFAILGNHDSMFIAEHFESLGVQMLINDSAVIEGKGFDKIIVSGIGDRHNLNNADWDKMELSTASDIKFRLLLCHNPDYYKRAESYGYSMMLCGHTHAGQFCLPGGIPIVTNCRAPRMYSRGRWQYGKMQGITSAGVGSSRLTARLNCPAELSVITLIRG